jgi:hypothetical protein
VAPAPDAGAAPSLALNLPELDEPVPPKLRDAHDGTRLLLELDAGFGGRLSSSAAFRRDEQLDFLYGLSGWIELPPSFAFGLGVERVGLGTVSSTSTAPSLRADYDATVFLLGVRAAAWRSELLRAFVELKVGAAVQTLEADGVRQDAAAPVPSGVFVCDATSGPHFALGGGVGAELLIAPRAAFVGTVGGSAYRLDGDVVGECAPGVGSTASLSARLGFAYHFDLDE